MVRKDRVELEGQWLELLERRSASGSSVTAFCKREGISSASFYRWRKRLAQATPSKAAKGKHAVMKAPPFLPVAIRGNPATVEIELPNHLVVRLPATVGTDVLSRVIHAVGSSWQERQGC